MLPSRQSLEENLWETLTKYPSSKNDSEVIQLYLTTPPIPIRVDRISEMVIDHFQQQLKQNRSTLNQSLIYSGIGILLKSQDYHNAFELINRTIGSGYYQMYCRNQVLKHTIVSGLLLLFVFAVQATVLHLVPIIVWACLDTVLVGSTWYLFAKILSPPTAGRVSWRNYQRLSGSYVRKDELIAVNKIITHFEEHHEINIRNFHTSEVRSLNDNSNGVTDGIVLFEPSNENDIMGLLRKEVYARQMVINDIPDELMMLEYWLNHGENFEWVEPDQDPAELITFNINCLKVR